MLSKLVKNQFGIEFKKYFEAKSFKCCFLHETICCLVEITSNFVQNKLADDQHFSESQLPLET